MKMYFYVALVMGLPLMVFSQSDSTWEQQPKISIVGFLDIFYVYDFNKPEKSIRQPFLYNHNRHNEFNLNLGFLNLGLEHKKYRSKITLQTGTYTNDNYKDEPGLLKSIFEANIGISLNKYNNFWLDAGVLPSHIGFESAISVDNQTLTRSILAENSPYFFTGVKLTYNPNKKLELAAMILNGWQRIQRLQGNSLPSLGTQLKYEPAENLTLNWSTFIGTNDPDSIRRMRYFNNFYGQFDVTDYGSIIIGFDIGTQQKMKDSKDYNLWFSPVIIAQLALTHHWKTAFRVEYYHDEEGVMIPTGTTHGFRTTGISLNLDYAPTQTIVCRVEGRWLNSKDRIFETPTGLTNNNFIIATSLGIRFSDTINRKI